MPTPVTPYVVSVLIMAVSIPLILRKIPKNAFYGFRIPRTLSGTDEYWYEANQRAGFAMFLAGVVSLLAAAALPLFLSDQREVLTIWTVVVLASVLAAAIFSLWRETKIAQ